MKKIFQNPAIGIIIISILGRLIPHIPNVTPITGMCLFIGMNLSRQTAFSILLITLIISDIGLALLFNYPIFGYWTLFVYTGFITIMFISFKLHYSQKILPIYILGSSLVFWIWTNFGVWLTTNLYPKTLIGLETCYIAALPFLRNSLIGDMTWGLIFLGVFNLILERKSKKLRCPT